MILKPYPICGAAAPTKTKQEALFEAIKGLLEDHENSIRWVPWRSLLSRPKYSTVLRRINEHAPLEDLLAPPRELRGDERRRKLSLAQQKGKYELLVHDEGFEPNLEYFKSHSLETIHQALLQAAQLANPASQFLVRIQALMRQVAELLQAHQPTSGRLMHAKALVLPEEHQIEQILVRCQEEGGQVALALAEQREAYVRSLVVADAGVQAQMAEQNAENVRLQGEVRMRDEVLAERDEELAERDEELAERDEELAERDEELAQRNARIARLEALLAQVVSAEEPLGEINVEIDPDEDDYVEEIECISEGDEGSDENGLEHAGNVLGDEVVLGSPASQEGDGARSYSPGLFNWLPSDNEADEVLFDEVNSSDEEQGDAEEQEPAIPGSGPAIPSFD